jgi:hypothetical protein
LPSTNPLEQVVKCLTLDAASSQHGTVSLLGTLSLRTGDPTGHLP